MEKEEIIRRVKQVDGLAGMTVNERLFSTGLLDVFDVAKKKDKELARIILQAIGVDEVSIKANIMTIMEDRGRIQTAYNKMYKTWPAWCNSF